MKKHEEEEKEAERLMQMDERHRPFNSGGGDVEMTEEEMEAYRRKRVKTEDPMAKFL